MLDSMTLDTVLTTNLVGKTIEKVYRFGGGVCIVFKDNSLLEIKSGNKVIKENDVGKVQRASILFDVVHKISVQHEL